jgi:hypothetical protein
MASVQMAHRHAVQAHQDNPPGPPRMEQPMASDRDNAMPCHQHQAQSVHGKNMEQGMAMPEKGSSKSKHSTPDCCKSGTCRCACLHGVAAIPMLPFNAAFIEHAYSMRPMVLGHAAPALPHLIRPPIG